MNDGQPTHLDLFSGIGGFALAAQWAGFRTVAFCEIEPYCQAIIKARFGAIVANGDATRMAQFKGKENNWSGNEKFGEQSGPWLHGDIRQLDGRLYTGVTIITGGFPCQPFSCAGKRRGKEDDRYLWPEMLRVVSEARPAWLLGENVAGIINMELDRVLSDLEGIGYAVWPLVIPACAVDAKQRRDRVWILGNVNERRIRRTRTQGNQRHTTQPSEDVANRIGRGLEERKEQPTRSQLPTGDGSCDRVPDANGQPLGRTTGPREECCLWLPEPDMGRVAHGIPARVDRIKGLGNAIVPQVAFQILKEIWKAIY